MKTRLTISAGLCFYLVLLILLLPLKWIFALLFAAIFHEFCHCIAILLCGYKISALSFLGSCGRISLPEMSRGKELLCSMAGPLGSFLLVALGRWMPVVAVCAFVQGAYNLLPVYPMDGGRIVSCILSLITTSQRADRWRFWIERITCLAILLLGMWATCLLKLGLFPVILSITILLRSNSGKIPCKQRVKRLQ